MAVQTEQEDILTYAYSNVWVDQNRQGWIT